MTHLKKRFAHSKRYQWYFESIVNLRMTQKESVSDYYDRVLGLLSGAKHTLEEKYNARYADEPESSIMMKPVIDCALDAFIRGLPDDMSIFVDTGNPKDLSEALEYALHIEERLNYAEKSRAVASSYYISHKDTEPERPRSPSSYSKLMNSILKNEQKPATGNQKTVTFGPSHAGIPSGSYPQNYAPYPPPHSTEKTHHLQVNHLCIQVNNPHTCLT